MFTLEQIIKMEEAVSTRKLPVDIAKLMDKRRYSHNEDRWVRIGDLPLHRVLRAWAKEPGNTIVEPSQ
tara:strand:+ start:399 stop:602 length:204 start_codon:yes stop_codon:yes gene_type:complete